LGESLNVLLIPLLGGFLFVVLSKLFRHHILNHGGQYLFLLSASIGFFFLVLSFFITKLIASCFPEFAEWWTDIVPFLYSGTTSGAIILALLSTIPFTFMEKDKVIEFIIMENGDSIDKMLWEAFIGTSLVCITLDNDKVYVGFVSNPYGKGFNRISSINISPSLSGYRSTDDRSVEWTNYYYLVKMDVVENPDEYTGTKIHLGVAIPLSRIVSINKFDPIIYQKLNVKTEEDNSIT